MVGIKLQGAQESGFGVLQVAMLEQQFAKMAVPARALVVQLQSSIDMPNGFVLIVDFTIDIAGFDVRLRMFGIQFKSVCKRLERLFKIACVSHDQTQMVIELRLQALRKVELQREALNIVCKAVRLRGGGNDLQEYCSQSPLLAFEPSRVLRLAGWGRCMLKLDAEILFEPLQVIMKVDGYIPNCRF